MLLKANNNYVISGRGDDGHNYGSLFNPTDIILKDKIYKGINLTNAKITVSLENNIDMTFKENNIEEFFEIINTTYKIKNYGKFNIEGRDIYTIHKGDNNCPNISIGDEIDIDGDLFKITKLKHFINGLGMETEMVATYLEPINNI